MPAQISRQLPAVMAIAVGMALRTLYPIEQG